MFISKAATLGMSGFEDLAREKRISELEMLAAHQAQNEQDLTKQKFLMRLEHAAGNAPIDTQSRRALNPKPAHAIRPTAGFFA